VSATVIAAVNRKGGVGKTSCTFSLAGYFAQQGNKVLLIDNEPQHSLSTGLFGSQIADSIDPAQTVAALYSDDADPEPSDLIHGTALDNIRIVPGCDELTEFNRPQPEAQGRLQFALREFIEEVRDQFDIILIDNPPNLQLCSWAAMTAADFCLVVSQPEDYGSQGCVAVRKVMQQVLQSANPNLKLAGYLLNMVDRRLSLHKAFTEVLRKTYGPQVFNTILPLSVTFKEAVSARKPVTLYKPNSKAAVAVCELGEELTDRMNRLRTIVPQATLAQSKAAALTEAV